MCTRAEHLVHVKLQAALCRAVRILLCIRKTAKKSKYELVPPAARNLRVRAGPAKKRTLFPKALAPPLLQVRTWKLHALTLAQHCTCRRRTYMKKIRVFFHPRLDLAEISAKTQKHQLFHTKFVKKSSFSVNVKFGGDNAEDKRRTSIQVSLPNSPPTKRCGQSSIPYIS